jgi:PAS domain S-box-containing protein
MARNRSSIDVERAERALRESEDCYRDLVENSGILIGTHDEEGCILSVNRATLKLAGYERADDLIGRSISDLLPPGVRHLFHSYLATILQQGRAQGLMRVATRGGEERIIEYDNSLRRQGPAKPIVRCIGRDVTEQKRTERALRESQERYRLVAENSQELIALIDAEGKIIYASPSYFHVLGHTTEALECENLFRFTHPDDASRVQRAVQHLVHAGGRRTVEFRLKRVEGDWLEFETIVSAIEDATGAVKRLLLFSRDISERRLFEQALQDKNEELEKALLAKDRFLASMSHELRTPLNAVIGFTGTLLMRLPGPLTEDQSRQLQTIRSSAKHLLSLINDLLDLAKIESGDVPLKLEPVLFQGVVEEVCRTLGPLAEKKGLRLGMTVPEEKLTLNTDRRALSQILLNLTSNAIKFTERGEVGIVLGRETDNNGQWTRLSVRDTGLGIRPEDQVKLFQAFSQVDGNLRRNEGSGLGLHLSQKLAQLLGGQINFKSEYGKGSTFTFSLPER